MNPKTGAILALSMNRLASAGLSSVPILLELAGRDDGNPLHRKSPDQIWVRKPGVTNNGYWWTPPKGKGNNTVTNDESKGKATNAASRTTSGDLKTLASQSANAAIEGIVNHFSSLGVPDQKAALSGMASFDKKSAPVIAEGVADSLSMKDEASVVDGISNMLQNLGSAARTAIAAGTHPAKFAKNLGKVLQDGFENYKGQSDILKITQMTCLTGTVVAALCAARLAIVGASLAAGTISVGPLLALTSAFCVYTTARNLPLVKRVADQVGRFLNSASTATVKDLDEQQRVKKQAEATKAAIKSLLDQGEAFKEGVKELGFSATDIIKAVENTQDPTASKPSLLAQRVTEAIELNRQYKELRKGMAVDEPETQEQINIRRQLGWRKGVIGAEIKYGSMVTSLSSRKDSVGQGIADVNAGELSEVAQGKGGDMLFKDPSQAREEYNNLLAAIRKGKTGDGKSITIWNQSVEEFEQSNGTGNTSVTVTRKGLTTDEFLGSDAVDQLLRREAKKTYNNLQELYTLTNQKPAYNIAVDIDPSRASYDPTAKQLRNDLVQDPRSIAFHEGGHALEYELGASGADWDISGKIFMYNLERAKQDDGMLHVDTMRRLTGNNGFAPDEFGLQSSLGISGYESKIYPPAGVASAQEYEEHQRKIKELAAKGGKISIDDFIKQFYPQSQGSVPSGDEVLSMSLQMLANPFAAAATAAEDRESLMVALSSLDAPAPTPPTNREKKLKAEIDQKIAKINSFFATQQDVERLTKEVVKLSQELDEERRIKEAKANS